jgi:hypothetical protein
MIDSVYVLGKLGLRPGMSVTRAITAVGMRIDDSTDQLKAANKIIISLGAKPVSNTALANVIAKALIEQAVVHGEAYDPEKAIIIANDKYNKIMEKMPYVFATDDQGNPTSGKKGRATNDKKTQALEIFNRESGKGLTNTAIAEIIATELEISLANAQYYVTRVFAKYSK